MLCCYHLSAANAKLFPIHDGEHCGFSDPSGKVVIPPQFSDCGDFSEGLAPVLVDELWGYIDENGSMAIPPRFLAVDSFSEGLAFATIGPESKAVIDRNGKILFSANYYQHGKFSEGLAPVHLVQNWVCTGEVDFEIREECPDGKGFPRGSAWGYIDPSGSMAISPRFFSAAEFHEGLAHADGGFIDHQGNEAIPGPFSEATSFVNGVAAVQVNNNFWGYIDTRGNWLALPAYDEAGMIHELRGLVRLDGKYGYVDTSGALLVAPQFDGALPFSEGRAAVRKDAKWGYLDASGKVAIPFQFDAAQSFQEGFATVAVESRTAVIDKNGMLVETHPATLAQTFQRLQGFEVEPDRKGPLSEILPILSVYKEQLRQLAVESLKEFEDPAAAKAAIEAKLRRAGIGGAKEGNRRPYGRVDVEVVQPSLQPQLLSVLFHLGLSHATDTSLSLFRRGRAGWEIVFNVDRNDYFKWELDAYHMEPPQFTASDSKGSSLMLFASDSGRYGDGTYELWVDVFRVDASFHTDRLFHKIFGSKNHQIALDPTGFRLETIEMEHDSARAGYRVFPYRYEIRGDRVIRVAPIGFDVHDFVGEWGNLPWDEAAKWSDSAHLGRIQEYYKKIRGDDGYFGGEFGEVQVCDAQQKLWQIGLGSEDDDAIYFLVEQKDKWTFVVKDIGTTMREGCKDVESKPGEPFSTMFSKPLEW
jgi:hypothetical protein